MSVEVQWILELTVNSGPSSSVQSFVDEISATTRENEPGALIYEYYLSDDETECTVIERYTDSDAAMLHIRNFEEQFADRFFALFELRQFRVFGPASDELVGTLTGLGATFDTRIGGFARD